MDDRQWVTQEEIGQRVRELRQARGFSQERLAHEAAQIYWQHHPDGPMLTIHWVMRLERAFTNVIDVEKLSAVAAALGVPLSRLVLPESEARDPLEQLAVALRAAGMKPAAIQKTLEDLRQQVDG